MQKAICFNIILILNFISFGCSSNKSRGFSPTITKEIGLPIIENLIIEGKYEEALEIYSELIKANRYLNSSEINNALSCSISIKNWKKAIFYSKLLVRKGIPLQYFDNPKFDNLKRTKVWKNFHAKFSEFQAEFNSKKNQTLIEELGKLHESDQQAYCNIPIDNTLLDSAFVVTHSIDSSLVKLFQTHGFPTEEMVGVDFNSETKSLSILPKYSALYRHSYQANSKLIDTYLKTAIEKGYLPESMYEFMTGSKNFQFIEIDCKIYENIEISKKDSIKSDRLRKLLKFTKTNLNRDMYLFYVPYAKWQKETVKSIPEKVFLKYYNYLGENADCTL